MNDEFSIESLRKAITAKKSVVEENTKEQQFQNLALRYEQALQQLIMQIKKVVDQIPEFAVTLEEEKEIFSSPAFPGLKKEIRDQRLRISLSENFILFDPSGEGLLSAMGQIEIKSSRPIPYMIEKILYLIPDSTQSNKMYWGYRSIENLSGAMIPFTQKALLKLLHTVFA